MNQSIACLLCGKDAHIIEAEFPGYKEPDTFAIYECPHCDTQFSYPRVETALIYELIYKNAEKVSGYDRYYKYKNAVKAYDKPLQYLAEKEEAYWVVNDVLEQDLDKKDKLKILEVGCGMGYLTYSLMKEGFNVTGLDISQEAINDAIMCFGQYYICADVFEYAKSSKEEYDRIIFTQVFEHVEEPVKWLDILMTMLKKNGKIILTTENKSIYPPDTTWQSDLPPVHLWWFSEQSMNYIANKLNAKVSFIDFSNYQFGEDGIDVFPVTHFKQRFDKYGEPITADQLPRNSLLKNLVKSNKIVKSTYLVVNPLYMRYFRGKKKRPQIIFGKRRGVMGCIFIKQ
ncbi:MAG: class I SAM-dependent methyltransferase [Draconibacterium sp.]